MAELQRDPITRGDFLGFGLLGTIMGAILTIPPVAFVLSPVIKTRRAGPVGRRIRGWHEVGSIVDVKEDEPAVFEVEFPIEPDLRGRADPGGGSRSPQKQGAVHDKERRLGLVEGADHGAGQAGVRRRRARRPERPSILDEKIRGLHAVRAGGDHEQAQRALQLVRPPGLPGEVVPRPASVFLCPCHGGLYDINGGWVGGPPPRGMYRYTEAEVREDGKLYVKHAYDIEDRAREQGPAPLRGVGVV